MYNLLMQAVKASLFMSAVKLTHCFTTRLGGSSQAPYNTNNLAFHVEDNPEVVMRNHMALAKDKGYTYQNLVHMKQIHSDKIVIVDPKIHNFKNPPECDALITNQTGIPLMVMVADCTPVLFYDPSQNVIAVAHAGRAGAIQGIVPKTITKMHTVFGSRIEDILIVLGPSIGVCCYAVGEKIAQEMTKDGFGLAIVYKKGQYYLDVNAIIKQQLQELGIKDEKVEDLSICNACEHSTFFSYRADKQKTGRFAGIIMLED